MKFFYESVWSDQETCLLALTPPPPRGALLGFSRLLPGILFLVFGVFFNVYLFLRERERERVGEGQSEKGDTES